MDKDFLDFQHRYWFIEVPFHGFLGDQGNLLNLSTLHLMNLSLKTLSVA